MRSFENHLFVCLANALFHSGLIAYKVYVTILNKVSCSRIQKNCPMWNAHNQYLFLIQYATNLVSKLKTYILYNCTNNVLLV